MSHTRPSLLTRLHRHRGLWVLAVAVLMIRLVSGSVCLADPVSVPLAAHASGAAAVSVVTPPTTLDTPDDAGCLLGEVADDHCACAHTLPIPTVMSRLLAQVLPNGHMPLPSDGMTSVEIGSLLRPPIA